ncbi:hypothetical protein GFB49_13600 [Epibacterium sp. SM1979]|uniref:SMODS-associated and fused to various effectors domain-containing protein n=1 Tax=Tritonibacter litoralis TaxID=2662264 RepID=A0A843YI66_9RHOB|nr:hypothetical protein [Tritonibacter litoralis]MQQ09498.1 hypothetical protein [Tritonibacter litoralis]
MSEPISCAEKSLPRVLVGALGYEARSSQFMLSEDLDVYQEVLVFDYEAENLHSYLENKEIYSNLLGGRAKACSSKSEIVLEIGRLSQTFRDSGFEISVDFSSLDRGLIADLVLAIYRNRSVIRSLEVLYFPQTFSKPELKLETVTKFGPISPEFSGSSRSSTQKLCMIVGAGYEFGKVIGAQDRLEPDEMYVFSPVGTDPKFEDAVKKANYEFEFIGDTKNVVNYNLSEPEETFSSLFELVRHKKSTHRVLLLPMGPKILAVFSLLIAVRFHPDVRVWHYSTHKSGDPQISNAFASGQRIALRFSSAAIFGEPQD